MSKAILRKKVEEKPAPARAVITPVSKISASPAKKSAAPSKLANTQPGIRHPSGHATIKPLAPGTKPAFSSERKTYPREDKPFRRGGPQPVTIRPVGARPSIRPLAKPLVNKVGKDPAPIKNRKKSPDTFRLFAICPGNLDDILKKEIEALPANILQTYPGGVEFEGDLELAYEAILKLRTASRVLLLLKDFKKIFKPEELYEAIHTIVWTKVFEPSSTFAVYLTESQSTSQERRIRVNPQFWALKAKDAIVDQFQQECDSRPSVDREDPDITIRLHLHDQMLKVYLDLSGPSLHERGYRTETLEAPMKENLAAGLLLLAGWDQAAKEKTAFYDPFCGSGTLLVEAALIATHTAPGLFRNRFGFMSWMGHHSDIFERVHARLKSERITDPALLPEIFGSDVNVNAVNITKDNLRRAGVDAFVKVKTEEFESTTPPAAKGLMVTNPPYGVRLDEVEALKLTYQKMGSTFKHQYKGWTVGVITSEKTLLHAIALKPSQKFALHNGGLESQFSIFQLY